MAYDSHVHDRSALVVYGSETGGAQDVAEELGRLTQRLHFRTTVAELDSIAPARLLQYTVVLFAISTTGQGDLPSNSRKFWRLLRSIRLRQGCLQALRFASFGLGDSSYPKFNWAHRKLYSRLIQLGSQSICERGESDEQHPEGVDGTFLPWAIKLRASLLEWFSLPEGLRAIPDEIFLEPTYHLSLVKSDAGFQNKHSADSSNPHLLSTAPLPAPQTIVAELVENSRITPEDHWQDVRHMKFRIPSIEYNAGDVATVYPENNPDDVNELIQLMHWSDIADVPLEFVASIALHELLPDHASPLARQSMSPALTLRSLLTSNLDITCIPRRSFFANLTHFTTDETQKERLLEFTDPLLIDELYDYTTRPRRSILEVLQEFHTVKIPWKWAAHVLPPLRGRQYSIASGGLLKTDSTGSGRIELLVAVVKYRTVIKRTRQGVCTRYLASLAVGTQINILVSKGSLTIPQNKPLIMVGPGTGLAPLRAMLYDRSSAQDQMQRTPSHALFYGGRNRAADFFFESEWPDLKNKMDLDIITAFSRDQKTKFYVQDAIRNHASLVARIIRDGVVIVCGSSGKMPQAVREALIEVVEKELVSERAAAENFLIAMEKDGRYLQETW